MTPKKQQLLRQLPSVAGLLELDEVNEWLAGLPRATVVASLRAAVEELRARIVSGKLSGAVDRQELLALAEQRLHDSSIPSLRRVVNATGIVLHTALGRAPLADAVIEAIADACAGYCNLEYDIDAGGRGQRNAHVVDELTRLTGAEAATVVNNNAAATMLILQTLAAGREVVVSRGQLIEIGGSFRLPDIVRAGGVTLREVGTTNRTRLSDYERAITDATAALMHVHTSNYRIIGFTESVPVGALATLAHRFGLIAVDDQGSGALVEVEHLGLPPEPCVRHSIECGVDLVCFSGDKLLGGPQCGIIVGRCELIERLNSNPLMRTYRVDKLTLLALEATLRCYRDPDSGTKEVPALAMLTASTDELADRAGALCDRLTAALPDETFSVGSDVGYAGGGSMPACELPTVVVQWCPSTAGVDRMIRLLRSADVPVVARVRNDAICFDVRTVRETDLDNLVESVSYAVWECQADVESS